MFNYAFKLALVCLLLIVMGDVGCGSCGDVIPEHFLLCSSPVAFSECVPLLPVLILFLFFISFKFVSS